MKSVVLSVVSTDNEGMTLSVERVNFVFLIIIEALIRKIFLVAVHLALHDVTHNLLSTRVVEKVVMGQVIVMEQVHEEGVAVDVTQSDEGVGERAVAHSVVVDAQ